MTRRFHWLFMWKMDPMLGFDIRLVFPFPPRDSTLQYKKCVHLWNNFPCIIILPSLFWLEKLITNSCLIRQSSFKGIVENRALPSLHARSHEIRLTVPLSKICKQNCKFRMLDTLDSYSIISWTGDITNPR